ncbi:hypothetical protein DACRYDRAFT_16916 [Dacryopinax primogenitus]|uniref:Peptide hydrolase n=1 Tax=Dacryopinax primogenitus (strain DJM 731) TaxID=1858805 RepID=M5G3N3_DACPD|nr:uncharacterized protein DACRYDRAFT_16916 [Dacryopinax primogenitus]EJU00467.1 hypothetical protein DACRYDRAFT_16916 [Dacryopinax primogenitus]
MAPAHPHPRPAKSLLELLLIMCPLVIGIPWLALHIHYTISHPVICDSLPEPIIEQYHPLTGTPQLSEHHILNTARYLSESIGYRTVGTREHALADVWMSEQLQEVQSLCEEEASRRRERGEGGVECEIWRQEGSGKHRVYKSYHGLTNHILRLSANTTQSKAHAVLVNSHLDSTLPSPGAADDAVCVGVMLELIRVLVHGGWSGEWSIIFLFNHAEESLQDASHLFSTQHPLAPTVQAVINLEAAGTTGPELLFQATSQEMIAAYSHVPRPHGSVLANDVFNSGIIISDTDFGQFVKYLNVTGLDMAIVGNSYLYHTRKDLVENIQPGAAQHMAENVLALLNYLTSARSPLPHLTEYTAPATVYYSLLSSIFFSYSYDLALVMSVSLLFWALALALVTTRDWTVVPRAWAGIVGGMAGALGAANLMAYFFASILCKPLSWFAREWLCILLYAPPALLGAVFVQLLVHPPPARPQIEHQSLTSLMLFYSFVAFAGQMAGIGSSYLYFINALSLWVATALNELLVRVLKHEPGDVNHWTYAVGSVIPLIAGSEALAPTLQTGRLGRDAPVEHIIASIVSFLTFYMAPFVLPFAHRFGRPALRTITLVLLGVSVGISAVFAAPGWREFDRQHQNRFFVVHIENITSHDYGLHVATLNSASGFSEIVNSLAGDFAEVKGVPRLTTELGDKLAWDVFHPVSDLVTSYAMDLSPPEEYVSHWRQEFSVHALDIVLDPHTDTRTFTLHIDHPGLIWTVVSFQAEVLEWDLPDAPVEGHALHKIKEASFYMADQWSIRMTLNGTAPVLVNFVGIEERSMWPGKKARQGENREEKPSMRMFERLETWLEQKSDGGIDVNMFGCIAGAVEHGWERAAGATKVTSSHTQRHAPSKLLYFDGARTLDTQDVLLYGNVSTGTRWNPFGRIVELCDWGKQFGIDGFLRMEFDFEIMYCNFTNGMELISSVNVVPCTWERTPSSVELIEHRLSVPTMGNPPLPEPTGPPRRGPGRPDRNPTPPEPPVGWQGSLRTPSQVTFEALHAGYWHNFAPLTGIKLEYWGLTTFYDPKYGSLVPGRWGLDAAQYRLANISEKDASAWKRELEGVLIRPETEGSGIDWGNIMRHIVERHADRLEFFRHLLRTATRKDGGDRVTPTQNLTKIVENARLQVLTMLSPYLSRAAVPPGKSASNDRAWLEPTVSLCTGSFTQHMNVSRFTPQEHVLKQATDTTAREICRTLGLIWLSAFSAESVTLPSQQEQLLNSWLLEVERLMAWLDWAVWLRCTPVCGDDEICSPPQWPFDGVRTGDEGREPHCISRVDFQRGGRGPGGPDEPESPGGPGEPHPPRGPEYTRSSALLQGSSSNISTQSSLAASSTCTCPDSFVPPSAPRPSPSISRTSDLTDPEATMNVLCDTSAVTATMSGSIEVSASRTLPERRSSDERQSTGLLSSIHVAFEVITIRTELTIEYVPSLNCKYTPDLPNAAWKSLSAAGQSIDGRIPNSFCCMDASPSSANMDDTAQTQLALLPSPIRTAVQNILNYLSRAAETAIGIPQNDEEIVHITERLDYIKQFLGLYPAHLLQSRDNRTDTSNAISPKSNIRPLEPEEQKDLLHHLTREFQRINDLMVKYRDKRSTATRRMAFQPEAAVLVRKMKEASERASTYLLVYKVVDADTTGDRFSRFENFISFHYRDLVRHGPHAMRSKPSLDTLSTWEPRHKIPRQISAPGVSSRAHQSYLPTTRPVSTTPAGRSITPTVKDDLHTRSFRGGRGRGRGRARGKVVNSHNNSQATPTDVDTPNIAEQTGVDIRPAPVSHKESESEFGSPLPQITMSTTAPLVPFLENERFDDVHATRNLGILDAHNDVPSDKDPVIHMVLKHMLTPGGKSKDCSEECEAFAATYKACMTSEVMFSHFFDVSSTLLDRVGSSGLPSILNFVVYWLYHVQVGVEARDLLLRIQSFVLGIQDFVSGEVTKSQTLAILQVLQELPLKKPRVLKRRIKPSTKELEDFEAIQLADQLTILLSLGFRRIQVKHLIAWVSPEEKSETNPVNKFKEVCAKVQSWVKAALLGCSKGSSGRERVKKKFLYIAQRCLESYNLAGTVSITSTLLQLQEAGEIKLRFTREQEGHPINGLVAPSPGEELYWNALASKPADTACVPWLDPHESGLQEAGDDVRTARPISIANHRALFMEAKKLIAYGAKQYEVPFSLQDMSYLEFHFKVSSQDLRDEVKKGELCTNGLRLSWWKPDDRTRLPEAEAT